MYRKVLKKIILIISILMTIIVLSIIGLLTKQSIVDKKINNSFSSVYSNEKYKRALVVDGIEVIKQEISCGYATIQMFADWLGKDITEQALFKANDGKISTAMGNGFCAEMNKQFSDYVTTRYPNLTNIELIDKVYNSLANGIPVPVEFAALFQTDKQAIWTLHFGIVSAMDIPNDSITVSNPYGYKEVYSVEQFLNATRYASYENMSFYLRLAFAIGIFHKNTIYIVE